MNPDWTSFGFTRARRRRLMLGSAVASVATLSLTGCGNLPPRAAVTPSASAAAHDMAMGSGMSSAAMDTAMAASIAAFPAKTTGVGAQPLAPTVLPDGTKQFDLTAALTSWEVSPGKKVEAWTYNGTVPGPAIHVAVGDRVQVIVHNRLPESTTMHFHGIQTPFAQDGTADVSQPPITPGSDHTYVFTPIEVATGFYHSHDDAVKQLPNGMFGSIFVGDMPVPAGVTVTGPNHPFFIDDGGVIGLSINGKSFPATQPFAAHLGEWIEVTYVNAGAMNHPFHLHEFSQLVIALDGHPLAAPYERDTIDIAPGQRYTILIHATQVGTWVWHCHILPHVESATGMFGMVTALVVT